MSALKFRATASGTRTGTAGSISTNKPSGTLDNDWLIAISQCTPSGGQTITLPAGFTSLYSHASGYAKIGYKLASSEGATYSTATSGGSGDRAGRTTILSYSGGDPSVPPMLGTLTTLLNTNSYTTVRMPLPLGVAMLLTLALARDTTGSTVNSGTDPFGTKRRVLTGTSDTTVSTSVGVFDQYVSYGQGLDRSGVLSPSGGAPVCDEILTFQLLLFQAPLAADTVPTRRRVVLAEIDYWNEVTAAVATKKYSDYGVIFTDHIRYEPRIMNRVIISQQGVDTLGAGGRVVTTASELELDNKDGALNELHELMLAVGRRVVIKVVEMTSQVASDVGAGASSAAATVFTGVVAATRPEGTKMRLVMSDLTENTNVPLQGSVFDGTAGLGGGAELEGMTKPITLGRVYNIFPVDLGSVNMGSGSFPTYMVNSREVNNTRAVRIRGVSQTEVAIAPAAGEYLPWDNETNGAVFQLGATPDGVVTCDLSGDDPAGGALIYANQTGEVITRMLTGFNGVLVEATDIDTTSFADIDTFLPGEIGWHNPVGSKKTIFEAVNEVCRHAAVWLSGGRNGKLRMSVASPGPAEKIRLRETDVVALQPSELPAQLQPPPTNVDVKCVPNWYPIDDIASSVSGSTRQKLSSPGQTKRATSTIISTRVFSEKTWTLPGLFFSSTDALDRAEQLQLWVETGLRAITVTTDRYRNRVEMGMSVELETYSRYGLESGFSGIVAGWSEDPAIGRVTMLLIGANGGGVELLESGGFELREDGSYELRE